MFAISAAVEWVVHARSLRHDSQILRRRGGVMNVIDFTACVRACVVGGAETVLFVMN